MTRKRTILLCIVIVIIACIAVGIYCELGQPQKGYDYKITFVDVLYLYAIRPILWVCVGVLAGVLTGLGKRIPVKLRRVMAIVDSAVVLVVACAMILHGYGINVEWAYTIASLCILHPMLLMIPGVIYGLCMKL